MAWFFSRKPTGPAKTAAQLAKRLVEAGVLTEAQADAAVAAVPNAGRTVEAVIAGMEESGTLTGFQAELVRKGEIENLAVGPYKLLYRNASGSFARVYRAEGPGGESVAIKVLRGRHAADKAQVAQFEREARMAKRMDHPNVVPILDIGSDGDRHYFTMEFVEGGNLKDFLQIRKKVAPAEAAGIVLDVARGLTHAAGLGITHRDLKPTNVLFDVTGTAKLVDFGLGGDGADGSDLRAVEYSTLEKATKAPRDDPRSDLFFLGGIFYELLAGVPPWPSTSDRNERRQVPRYRDVTPITTHDPSLPTEVVAVVEKLMSWSPAGRYQTAAEAEGALRRLHESLTDRDPPPDPKAAAGVGAGRDAAPRKPTVLLLEPRAKPRELVGEYLAARGFRVAAARDVAGGLAKAERDGDDRPDAVLVMGEGLGDDLFDAFARLKAAGMTDPLAVVAVVTAAQAAREKDLGPTGTARVLPQPASLGAVRAELHHALQAVLTESRMSVLKVAGKKGRRDRAAAPKPASGDRA